MCLSIPQNGGMDHASLYMLGIVFAATLIRSTFGFGEALFAVPLLALVLPLRLVTPLVVLLSTTIAAAVVAQDWRHVHLRGSLGLLLPSLAGIPCGLLLLGSRYQPPLKIALALLIIAFAAYSLLGRKPPHLRSDRPAWLLGCGFCAGVLGAAYGMNGPPLVVYGTMRRWSSQQFRATLQGYFLPASLLALLGYRLSGLWVPEVTHDYLICLPAAIPAIVLGRWLNRRMHPQGFARYVHAGLLAIGLGLLAQALPGRAAAAPQRASASSTTPDSIAPPPSRRTAPTASRRTSAPSTMPMSSESSRAGAT